MEELMDKNKSQDTFDWKIALIIFIIIKFVIELTMKITKRQLRRIIREEKARLQNEISGVISTGSTDLAEPVNF